MSTSSQPGAAWATMENAISAIGRFAWLIVLGGIGTLIGNLVVTSNQYTTYQRMLQDWWLSPDTIAGYQAILRDATAKITWYSISIGISSIILLAYTIKPLAIKCNAKDWDALINDKVGGISRMWVVGIVLAIFCTWGATGVLLPALMLATVGPGKGRMFKDT